MSREYFITCTHCGAVKQVRKPSEQTQRFCSRKCAALVLQNVTRGSTSSLGGLMRAHRVRLQIRARIAGLTPLEAFRQGYRLGLAKRRRVEKRTAAV